jgi:probable rRNA maturation factor
MLSPADLDLAFSADPLLAAPLRQAAAGLADTETGEALWQEQLAAWLAALAGELPERLRAGAYSLSLSLCDDAAIAELNEEWRLRPGPTDVLAFAACDGATDGPAVLPLPPELAGAEPLELGDIVISLETAARQASEAGHTLDHELRFLASHGLLHLLGWDHPDESSLAVMLARQDRLLADRPRTS